MEKEINKRNSLDQLTDDFNKMFSLPHIPCVSYIPLYSTTPVIKEKTEIELIMDELNLWLTNELEFFDKKLKGEIQYL
jgi:hypothetical protein